MLTKQDIVSSLAHLSVKERKEISAACTLLNSTSYDNVSDNVAPFYTEFSNVLNRTTREVVCPLHVLRVKSKVDYRTVVAGVGVIDEFIDCVWPSIKQAHRVAIYRRLVLLIVELLRQRDIPVTLRTVVNSLEWSPGLLDRAFPGYLAAGLEGMILNERKAN